MDSKISHPKFLSLVFNSLLLSAALLLGACASAPIQEMSDARQAIQAAKSIGASEENQANLNKATQFLKQAEEALEVGEYKQARVHALAARQEAIQAQQFATFTGY